MYFTCAPNNIPIWVQFGVSRRPSGSKRTAQLLDVAVQYAVRVLFVRVEPLLLLVFPLLLGLVRLDVDRFEHGFGHLLLPPGGIGENRLIWILAV